MSFLLCGYVFIAPISLSYLICYKVFRCFTLGRCVCVCVNTVDMFIGVFFAKVILNSSKTYLFGFFLSVSEFVSACVCVCSLGLIISIKLFSFEVMWFKI